MTGNRAVGLPWHRIAVARHHPVAVVLALRSQASRHFSPVAPRFVCATSSHGVRGDNFFRRCQPVSNITHLPANPAKTAFPKTTSCLISKLKPPQLMVFLGQKNFKLTLCKTGVFFTIFTIRL
jgi:hypothetical protein